MFRLLGILTIGNLLFGGRHHRRALRKGLFLGVLLVFFANREFDINRARDDVRDAAGKAGKAAQKAAKAFREEIRNARENVRNQRGDVRTDAVRTENRNGGREDFGAEAEKTIRALPQSGTKEASNIRELVNDLEKNTWSSAADVPTIDFPEEDGKFNTYRKYGYTE